MRPTLKAASDSQNEKIQSGLLLPMQATARIKTLRYIYSFGAPRGPKSSHGHGYPKQKPEPRTKPGFYSVMKEEWPRDE